MSRRRARVFVVGEGDQQQEIPIEIDSENKTLGRAAIFGLIPVLPLEVGKTYTMDLFAFSQGEIWNMNLYVEDTVTINWQDEETEAFKINLTGGKVDNTVYMTTDQQHKIVRIDVDGQDMQIVLRS